MVKSNELIYDAQMKLSEFDIINSYFTRQATSPSIIHGIGDDAAVLMIPPH